MGRGSGRRSCRVIVKLRYVSFLVIYIYLGIYDFCLCFFLSKDAEFGGRERRLIEFGRREID